MNAHDVALIGLASSLLASCQASASRFVQIGGPSGALSQSESAIQPEYPSRSVTKGSTGLAVVQIEVSPQGIVQSAEVLQAPDTDIAAEVVRAAHGTRFRPVNIGGKSRPQTGKLFYLFSFVDGVAKVRLPPFISAAEQKLR